MNQTEELIEKIEGNSVDIIKKIKEESIEVYNFLEEQFENSNVEKNYLFQFVYRSFYRLDNAGLTNDFKIEYFKILQKFRTNKVINSETIREIANRLSPILNAKEQESLQFSFITKLLNTIDNKRAIYDSEVARMFNYKRPTKGEFEEKLNVYLKQLEVIQNTYDEIIKNNLLPKTTSLFDETFGKYNLNQIKKLDFIVWSAGKIEKSK